MSETDCSQVLQELESFVDHELDAEQADRIKHHLDACDPCFDHAEFRERLRALVARKCCSEEVPEAVAERIRGLLEADPG